MECFEYLYGWKRIGYIKTSIPMTTANLIEIFCLMDEFCKYLKPVLKKRMVESPGKRRRNRPCKMSDSEVMTILVLFHLMRNRDLKTFYLGYVCNHMRKDFSNRLFYNRFVERQASIAVHLLLFMQRSRPATSNANAPTRR